MSAVASMSVSEARRVATGLCGELGPETVAAETAAGRYSAGPVWAIRPSPHYRASAMDGVALRAADTATAPAPLLFTDIGPDRSPTAGTERPACAVDTGQLIPEWADAVVRVEEVSRTEDGYEIGSPVAPGHDIRRPGEDIADGELLFSGGHRITAADIGAMLATGVTTVAVVRRPSVALIATGTEIVEPDREPAPGEVVEFNSRMIAAMIEDWGGHAVRLKAPGGSDQLLGRAIDQGLAEHDLVCVIAGSSVGKKDNTVEALSARGELLIHGIKLMPGRPAALASVKGRPLLAIPGYPVSAAMVCREIVGPMLTSMLGAPAARGTPPRPGVQALVRRKMPSNTGVEELVRLRLSTWNNEFVAIPLARGAGSIGSLSRADALLRIDAGTQGVDAGATVEIELLAEPAYIEMGVTVAGRCPTPLVEVAERLRRDRPESAGFHLGQVPMSDPDALRALAAGETHLAVVSKDAVDDTGELLERPLTGTGLIVLATPAAARFEPAASLLNALATTSG